MNRQTVIAIIAFVALILKLVFGIEIEQVIQAEIADILVNFGLVVTPVFLAIKGEIERRKIKQGEDTH